MLKFNLITAVMVVIAVLGFFSGSLAADPQTGEQVQNITISAGGAGGNSANYGASLTLGQITTGKCGSANFGMNQGFWSGMSGGGGCCDAPGDANDDGTANVGDAVYLISYVFKSGPAPPCMEKGDANCDSSVNVGDAVYLISYVFKSGPDPCCP